MKRVLAVIGGGAAGVIVMLAILQPWKVEPKRATPGAEPELASASRVADLAWTKMQAGELEEAQRLIAQAASLDPDLFEVALYQGHLDMIRDDHASARRSYTDALKRRAGDPRALAGRAAARFELKEYAGAVEDASAALASEPDAQFTRAAAYAALGRNEESVRDWTAYLARRPKDAQAWTNRGNVHERMGNRPAAVADWRQAVSLDPGLEAQLGPLIAGQQPR
jgi:tetratricopeptide (TPR) repeat protein